MDTQSSLALKYIQNTGTNIFLTGKAGTGKTTFLRRLKDISPKRMVVVAPTGVAAINAGGVTIHSFFQLPFGPYLPESPRFSGESPRTFPQNREFSAESRRDSHKFNREKVNILRSMDLLVIDEVSMVRADLLDAISDVLRRYRDRDKPFGGVQLLLIGDMQQLAPVAREEEWNLLKEHYASPYFFDSKALAESDYLCVELTHVYRQSDDAFVALLNKIRDNRPDDETLEQLNKRYIPNFSPDDKEGYITLTTHNYQAQRINEQKLAALPGKAYIYEAEVADDFPSYSYPTDERLELKLGAQVMFIKNDSSGERQYYNGKIGKVVHINDQKIVVNDERGNDITVGRETWQNVKYAIHAETQEITETVIGSFSQYPLKTAWAITIHKSQGLTFEKAVIDAAAAFSHGQVYVALSRCKTLEGMVLNSRITRQSLVADHQLEQYTSSLAHREANEEFLRSAEQQYFLKLILELFDFEPIQQRLEYASRLIFTHLIKLYPEWSNTYATSRDRFRTEVTEVGNRFQQQLRYMISVTPECIHDEAIQERIRKGASYFLGHMEEYALTLLKGLQLEIDNKETKKQIVKALTNLSDEFRIKAATLRGSRNGFSVARYLSAKSKARLEDAPLPKAKRSRKEKVKGESLTAEQEAALAGDVRHPELYVMLKNWRYQLSVEKGLPPFAILHQKTLLGIVNLLPTSPRELLIIPGVGKKILENYGEQILSIIDSYRTKHT